MASAIAFKLMRFLTLVYPTIIYLAFFSWLRLTLFYHSWAYFALIPLFFALEILLCLKRSGKKPKLKEIAAALIRATLLSIPIFIVVISIFTESFNPIKAHLFFELGNEAVGSPSIFTLVILVTLIISYSVYLIVKRFFVLFSLYLPMGILLTIIASAGLTGTEPKDLKYETIISKSDVRKNCPSFGSPERLALVFSRSTGIHCDGAYYYFSLENPFGFSKINQVALVKVKRDPSELACLYASGIKHIFSRPLFSSLYYVTSLPKTTLSALDKTPSEPALIVDSSSPLFISPARREFTSVYADLNEQFIYASLGINAGILKAGRTKGEGKFLDFMESGFAWNGSTVKRLFAWPDEKYIYAITRYAPAPLVQIRTATLKISNFYIENSIKPWEYAISDAVADPNTNALYCFIPSRKAVIALSHPSLKVMWSVKTPEPIKLAEQVSNRYLLTLSYKGKLYAFDLKLREFILLTSGLKGAGVMELSYGKLLVATSRNLLSIDLPIYLMLGFDAPKQPTKEK